MEVEPIVEASDVQSRSIFARTKHPITLKFEDVVYTIKTKTSSDPKKKNAGGERERKILKSVSGNVAPGEMLAMMGPSGSGKTTLLTALGGRLSGHLEGSITFNGRPFSSSMNRNMGFVSQDDVLYPHLTVTETLVYTALLRLPKTLTRQQKTAQAEAVMTELGLTVCRNSIIGGPLLRGVSGGERKRVSVGQEMLINPSLLYLDEPTSGLDSTTAHRIVHTLSELAKGGRTVVMTIHQPSSSLFYMFSKVLLLADGNPVYFGKGSDAMEYFAGIGYSPSVPMNPADFLLDLANGVPSGEANENRAAVKETLVTAYNMNLKGKVKDELRQISSNTPGEGQIQEKLTSEWTTSWWDQFNVLLERGLKERRHEAFSGLKVIEISIVAMLSGALWWKSGGHIQDQVGYLFFIAGFWAFFPVYQAIFTFPQERMMLTKERSSRMYRLSSYFMARLVGDLPMELILPTVFTVVTYWMVGLKPHPINFFTTLFVILLNVLVAQGIGLALGALIMDLKSATTLCSVIMLTFMLSGGFFVQKVPVFMKWVKYISLNYHSFKLLVSAQFRATEVYQCAPEVTCKIADYPSVAVAGFDHLYVSVLVMFAMLFLCRLASYLALMRVGVTN